MKIEEFTKMLKIRLKNEKKDLERYLTLKLILKPQIGKKVTKRIERLSENFSQYFKDFSWSNIDFRGKTYHITRTDDMIYSESVLDELNIPYSQGSASRIKKLTDLLSDSSKLERFVKIYTDIEESLTKFIKAKQELDEHQLYHDNPAHYNILKRILEDLDLEFDSKIFY